MYTINILVKPKMTSNVKVINWAGKNVARNNTLFGTKKIHVQQMNLILKVDSLVYLHISTE
jgi:hypothetical protein